MKIQGVYGAYFSKLNYRWSRDVRGGTWLKAHPVAEVVLVSTTLFVRYPAFSVIIGNSRNHRFVLFKSLCPHGGHRAYL